jgi:hypothetical protein
MFPLFGFSQDKPNTEGKHLPFMLSPFNNIIFTTILNDTDTLKLKFDTGATGLLLTHDAIKNKTQLLAEAPDSFKTQNYVPLKALASLSLGELSWDSLEIYPVRHSGQGTDGRFGWDLFKDRVVIIDYDKSMMLVQDELPPLGAYASLEIENHHGLLCINGEIKFNTEVIKGLFLFDTGYQKALLLDSAIANNAALTGDLSVIKETKLRNGAGRVFITKWVMIPALTIADYELPEIPTQLLNTSNPAKFPVHILGNEFLKRFNAVFDFRNMQVYLKPNGLYEAPYSENG